MENNNQQIQSGRQTPQSFYLMLIFSGMLLLVGLLYNYFSQRSKAKVSHKLPPGPKPWPILGNLLHVGTVPHVGLMRLTQKYGPLVYVRLGAIPHVVTDDPEIVKEFLKTQDHIFASRPGNVILAELLTYGGKDIGFAPYGQHWRSMRKICTLELFAPKRLESFQPLRTQEIQHILNSIFQSSQQRQLVDLRDIFSGITSNMMTRMLLGKRNFGPGEAGPEASAKLKGMIAEGILMMNGFNISDYLPSIRFLDIQGQERRMKRIMEHIDSIASELLDEYARRRSKRTEIAQNFGDILTSIPGENGDEYLPADVIKAVMVDMIAAGTDTPAVSSEWAMSELLKNPSLMQNVRNEIDDVVGLDRLVQETDLPHFRTLRAVLKESFRLHPVGAILIPHLAMEDAIVNGYLVPKNTRVLINIFSLNRNPSVWKDADQFKPERFLTDAEVEFIDPECRLIPFGAGRRMCPAASLGLTMVLLGLAHLVHAFEWESPKEINMDRAHGTMIRAQPLVAFAKPRLPSPLYTNTNTNIPTVIT